MGLAATNCESKQGDQLTHIYVEDKEIKKKEQNRHLARHPQRSAKSFRAQCYWMKKNLWLCLVSQNFQKKFALKTVPPLTKHTSQYKNLHLFSQTKHTLCINEHWDPLPATRLAARGGREAAVTIKPALSGTRGASIRPRSCFVSLAKILLGGNLVCINC